MCLLVCLFSCGDFVFVSGFVAASGSVSASSGCGSFAGFSGSFSVAFGDLPFEGAFRMMIPWRRSFVLL
jgi:hypothetical protein